MVSSFHIKNLLKKYRLVLFIILIPWVMAGILSLHRLSNKNIWDYPNTYWKSDDPCCSLIIDSNGYEEAYLTINGKNIQARFYITSGNQVYICDYEKITLIDGISNENILITGDIRCSSKKIVIKIKNDYVYGGKYDEIILYLVE